MPYSNSTPGLYKIPYWAKGERSSAQSNLRAAQIIENQLTGNSKLFASVGVIQEGTYTGIFSAANSSVLLASNGAVPPLEALVNQKYCNQVSSLQWTGIPDNVTAYLYAQVVETNIYAAGQLSTLQDKVVKAVFNTTGSTPSEAILLAIATTTGAAITINSSASIVDNGSFTGGKPIYYSFTSHRTTIPIDHPNLSVTDVKIANQAVLSRTIAPWDGLSSGTDVTNGKGVGRTHLKDQAVSIAKLQLNQGGTLPITADIALTGFINASSGLTTPGLISGLTIAGGTVSGSVVGTALALLKSGLEIYGDETIRGNLTVQQTATLASLVAPLANITTLSALLTAASGLDVYTNSTFRNPTTFQQLLTANNATVTSLFATLLSSRTTGASGLEMYQDTFFRGPVRFQKLISGLGFSTFQTFYSGLDNVGNETIRGTLTVQGPAIVPRKVRAVTGSTTIDRTVDGIIVVDATSGAQNVVVTLPDATNCPGIPFTVYLRALAANLSGITLQPVLSQTIALASTASITSAGTAKNFASEGANYFIN